MTDTLFDIYNEVEAGKVDPTILQKQVILAVTDGNKLGTECKGVIQIASAFSSLTFIGRLLWKSE